MKSIITNKFQIMAIAILIVNGVLMTTFIHSAFTYQETYVWNTVEVLKNKITNSKGE